MTKKIECCGMDAQGIDDFLDEAELQDFGTTRHPWPEGLKQQIKRDISGMTYLPAVKAKVNELVMTHAGPGLFNRGPFNLQEL